MDNAAKRSLLEDLAAGRLTAEEAERRLDEAPDERQPRPDLHVGVRTAEAVRIRARLSGGGLIEVVGDDRVSGVEVEGPNSCTVRGRDDSIDVAGDLGEQAVVRVNPDADLEVEINGADGAITGLRGSLQAVFNTANARIRGRFDHGDSRVYCNVGTVHLTLERGSDVRVVVRAVAQVDADHAMVNTGRGVWQFGTGAAAFEIGGNLGNVVIAVAE